MRVLMRGEGLRGRSAAVEAAEPTRAMWLGQRRGIHSGVYEKASYTKRKSLLKYKGVGADISQAQVPGRVQRKPKSTKDSTRWQSHGGHRQPVPRGTPASVSAALSLDVLQPGERLSGAEHLVVAVGQLGMYGGVPIRGLEAPGPSADWARYSWQRGS
ncbi:hypothetical protein VUR80DRAFT_7823 [Thermomyces stellatus]